MCITVIIPVYNVESYVKACVDSVLTQTFTSLEIILVDDGSDDTSGRICDEYANSYQFVHVIHKENGGLSSARNVGLEWMFQSSESEWVFFLDADDAIHPKTLELLLSAAKMFKADIAAGFFQKVRISASPVTIMHPMLMTPEDFWCYDRIAATIAPGKLYRRNLFEHVRFPVGKLHEDEFTTYKILFAVPNVVVIKSQLYYYFERAGSITQVFVPKRLDRLDAYVQQLGYFRRRGLTRAYWKSSWWYLDFLASMLIQIRRSRDWRNSKLMHELQGRLKSRMRVFNNRHKLPPDIRLLMARHPATWRIRWRLFLLMREFGLSRKSEEV